MLWSTISQRGVLSFISHIYLTTLQMQFKIENTESIKCNALLQIKFTAVYEVDETMFLTHQCIRIIFIVNVSIYPHFNAENVNTFCFLIIITFFQVRKTFCMHIYLKLGIFILCYCAIVVCSSVKHQNNSTTTNIRKSTFLWNSGQKLQKK